MNILLRSCLIGGLILFALACEDPDKAPILTFDDAGKGAYPALIEETPRFIDFNDIENSVYTYSLEFVDINDGRDVQTYDLELEFTSATGEKIGPIPFRSYSQSDFEDIAASGLRGLTNIQISATELIDAVGLNIADVEVFDQFKLIGSVVSGEGIRFGSGNSSAQISGTSFRGHFDFTREVRCASDIGGSYDAVAVMNSTDPCCPDPANTTAVVTLTDKGGGVYTLDDFSAGGYVALYSVFGISTSTDLSGDITDICDVISGSYADAFANSTINIEGSRDPNTGVITYTWDNSFGDTGEVTLTPQ